MSGHSKWHSIRHKKAVVDARRGKLFTKLIREIIVAAKMGGGDPEKNPRLRKAIEAARDANMPKDNIERAIKKGTGELEGEKFEEVTYEGYGPGGVAVFVEAATDNRNRTASEIRRIFSKHGGSLGESGCVAWMFKRKGYIVIEKSKAPDEEELFDIAVDAGAEDVKIDESNFVILTAPEDLFNVVKALEEKGIEITTKELGMIPDTYVKLEGKQAEQMLKLMEELEDHDDVQHVWANFDISEEEIEKFAG